MLLVAEMALFMLLIIPIPFTLKRRMFTYAPNPRDLCCLGPDG